MTPRFRLTARRAIHWLSLSACAFIGAVLAAQSELVIHKEGTKLYHRPGCPVVREGTGVLALSRGQAEARGYKPHPECDPSTATAPAGSAARPDKGPPAAQAPVTVYVETSKYYHRKDCRRVAATSEIKPVALDAAAKSHWPCPVCRPPILKKSAEPAIPGTNRRRGG